MLERSCTHTRQGPCTWEHHCLVHALAISEVHTAGRQAVAPGSIRLSLSARILELLETGSWSQLKGSVRAHLTEK